MFSCPPPLSPADCDSYCKASKGKLKINMKKYCKKDYGELPLHIHPSPFPGCGTLGFASGLAGSTWQSNVLHVKPSAPHRCWTAPSPGPGVFVPRCLQGYGDAQPCSPSSFPAGSGPSAHRWLHAGGGQGDLGQVTPHCFPSTGNRAHLQKLEQRNICYICIYTCI